jgi:hypothetical protein
MKQILHIFAKDVRRFWPEILISVGITAAFVWAYPVQWQVKVGFGPEILRRQRLEIVANVLTGLVPASWWLLIARLIHAETLVGDRQFWITRPYEWPKLLGAKALFVAAFVYLPFTAAQCALLIEAGFSPLHYLPGLLFNLLFATGILIVPLVAISAVTRNFVRMTLTLLAILLSIVAIAFLVSFVDSNSVGTPYEDVYSFPLILIIGISAIVLQYARRKVWLARALMVSAHICIAIAAIVLPTQGMVDSAFLRSATPLDTPLQVSIDQEERKVSVGNSEKKDEFEVSIPLRVEGVVPQHMVNIDDVKASMDGPNDLHWISSWHVVYNHRFLNGAWRSTIEFKMPKCIYEQFRATPVTLKLSFAATEARAGKPTQIPLSHRGFVVPGFGICPANSDWAEGGVPATMTCRSAFNQARLTYITVPKSKEPCNANSAEPQETDAIGNWPGSLEPAPAEFGITSVWTSTVNLFSESGTARYVCPGATLTFTPYELLRRTQFDTTIPDLTLPEFKEADDRLILNLSH